MQPGEIFLANFPFGDAPGMKLRPVLLLTGPLGSIPEIVVAYISSVTPTMSLPTDIVLDPASPGLAVTNLKVRSVLRRHQVATLHSSSLVRYLGEVPAQIAPLVDAGLRSLLRL